MSRTLIYLRNFKSGQLDNKIINDFDEIIDVFYPEIPKELDSSEINEKYVIIYYDMLMQIANKLNAKTSVRDFNLAVEGDLVFCILLKEALDRNKEGYTWNYYIPVFTDGKFSGWKIIKSTT